MTPCKLLEVLFCSQHSRFTMNDLKQISFDCCSIGSPKQHQKKKKKIQCHHFGFVQLAIHLITGPFCG